MARIIKPMIFGAIMGGLGLGMSSRAIVNYLDGGARPAYEAAKSRIELMEDLEDNKYSGHTELVDKTTFLRTKLNSAGRLTSSELEDMAQLTRRREEHFSRIDSQISELKSSPEYLAYEAEKERVDRDVSIFRDIVFKGAGILLLGAVLASEVKRFRYKVYGDHNGR